MSRARRARVARLLLAHPASSALRRAAGGVACHLVGGVLRDRLLGLPAKDLDAVVERDGERIAADLAQRLHARLVHLGREAFAAWRLVGHGFVLDLWDRRGVPLAADLERRDFTVDALALDLESGELADPLGGLGDLRRRVLRACSTATFDDDPLRLLRLPRLLVTLPGFTAEPSTVELARSAAAALAAVAAERVRDELAMIFAADGCHRALALLELLDLYPGLWIGQPGRRLAGARALPALEALPERTLTWRRLGGPQPDSGKLATVRWALSFLALPPGWPAAATARSLGSAGHLTRRRVAEVERLAEVGELPRGELPARRFLHRLGELWTAAALAVGSLVQGEAALAEWEERAAALIGLAETAGDEIFDPPTLIDGDEVQRILGIGAGPRVGRALQAVRRAQVEGRVRDRRQAREIVERTP